MRLSFKNVALIFLLCFTTSCSTRKSNFFSRSFHNTTTHYNWYFNAKETLENAIQKLENNHKEDYNQLIPIYPIGSEKDAQSVTPSLNKVVKKAAKAISLHSINLKGEEHNRWIDDCYLLIAKAYFYQREYIKASEALRHIKRQFEGQYVDFEAQLWLCRTYIAQGDLYSAELLLNSLVIDDEFPTKLNQQLSLIYAHYYIHKGDLSSASEELISAISESKKIKDKTRYHFILAQIYHQQKNYALATKHYQFVLRKSPSYEMAFQAKINRARAFDLESGDISLIRKELEKMLTDDKNLDFQDIIYFGLAELSMREEKPNEAIPQYRLSVSKSVTNDAQKAVSSLAVANLLYKRKNYRMAQAYYDTTIVFLAQNHPFYNDALKKQTTLSRLIENLDIISHQDSIQKIALMPENERNAFIDQIIRELEEDERIQQQLEAKNNAESLFLNGQNGSLNSANAYNQNQQNQAGKWYFYNSTTLSFGYSEFIRKWGKRKLEDHWRRANKSSISFDEIESDSLSETFDPKDRHSYVKDLPLTIEQVQLSNSKVIEAYYNAGVIYKEELEDLLRSAEMFEDLDGRFPKNDNRVMVLYYLYVLHQELQNKNQSNSYKQQLLSEFPKSEYAQIVSDPSFFETATSQRSEVEELYQSAFELYENRQYRKSLSACENALEKHAINLLKPHFDFLMAMCHGFIDGKKQLIVKLNTVKNKHQGHIVSKNAEELLVYLKDEEGLKTKQQTDKIGEGSREEQNEPDYVVQNDGTHYFIILFKEYDLDVNTAKTTFSNYHSEFYSLQKLNISSVLLDEQTHMISVREFENAERAMDYYNKFINSDARGPFGSDFISFVIAAPNFPTFFKNKDIKGYQKRFKQAYLRN